MCKHQRYHRFAIVIISTALFALVGAAFGHASPVGYRVEFVSGIGVHIVQVNLGSPSVKVTPILSARYPGGAEPLGTICAREKPVAAITGTFFSRTSLLPIGDIMIDGRLVHFGGMGSALAITPDNKVDFRRIPWGRQQDWGMYESVMAAGPMLLEGGEVALAPAHEKFRDPRVLGRASRAAIGVTGHNKLLMVTTRQSISLWQLAKVMRGLGCTDAINLDGGSSTGLYYRGSTIVRPSRSLVNVLAVHVNADPEIRLCQADRIEQLAQADSFRRAKAHEAYMKAQIPLATGQLKEAVRLLSSACELDPVNASYHARLGEALDGLEDGLSAAAAWTRAGEILLEKQQWDRALTHFQAALERDPDNQRAKEGLPAAYRGLGMTARASAVEGQLAFEAIQASLIRAPRSLMADLVHESFKLAGLPMSPSFNAALSDG
ncbi:MAG: phosphodiester glycosidase family protein [Armatimonadota bacterium]